MKPSLRYGLIALFFLAFFALTPFIVSFVTGIKYDSAQHKFVRTGSIYVKTLPKKVAIFLDGKAAGTSPKTIRFLNPGNYDVRLHKDGYFDWDKTLNVRAQYVTYTNQDLDNVVLFLTNPGSEDIKSGVQNFFAGSDQILYLTSDSLELANISNPTAVQQLSLPKNPGDLRILASNDENYFLLYDDTLDLVFDARANKIFDISSTVGPLSSAGVQTNSFGLSFSDHNDLYFLAKSNLYQIDWQKNTSKQILANVQSYLVRGSSIYYIQPDPKSGASNLYALISGNVDLLLSNLPNWTRSQIYLNNRNQLFILGDDTFYTAGASKLQTIAQGISSVQIYNQFGEILLASNNEIDLYNYFNGNLSSVTRSLEPIANPQLLNDLGWVLFTNNGSLHALEIDNRDHQNDYSLAGVGPGAKFYLDPSLQKVFLLNQGELKLLTIR